MPEQIIPASIKNHQHDYRPNFVLTREIIGAAVDAGHGHNSEKLIHEEYPELYIRRLKPTATNRRRPSRSRLEQGLPIADIRQQYVDAYSTFGSYGIEVVPFKIIDDEGEIVILTQRVHGLPVTEAIARKNPDLIQALDATLSGEVNYLKSRRTKDGEKYPQDAVGIGQLMWGHYYDETEADNKVIMVDIDPNDDAFMPTDDLKSIRSYLIDIALLVQGTLLAENKNNPHELSLTRKILSDELIRLSTQASRPGTINKIQTLLEVLRSSDLGQITEYMEL